MATEQRYLKAADSANHKNKHLEQKNSNYKSPEIGECLACLRDHQEAKMAAADSEQITGGEVTAGWCGHRFWKP